MKWMVYFRALLTLSALCAMSERLHAEDDQREAYDFFENHIRPVLVEHCVKCHGPQKSESGLRLDQRDKVLAGGDSGPAIVPGEPSHSLLLQAIRHENGLEMPPDGALNDAQIASVERWIRDGANWPEGMKLAGEGAEIRTGPISDDERAFWSFQPVRDPVPPSVDPSLAVYNDIDRFVHASLAEAGLAMRGAATKRALLRRATFDLTGLPPTPAELTAFLEDNSPQAFARVVDRLLASSAYGERWGRHWLDVVRYADTAGDTADYPTPLAYKYRNWVVRAFNADLPYNEFVRQQIAGDVLGQELMQHEASSSPEMLDRYRDMLTATGFIAISRRFGFDVENYHHLTIQDTIDTVGQSILGLSIGCARCHDHKFDPINMEDYYAWYGIFESTRYSFPGSEEKKKPYDLYPPLPPHFIAERTAEYEQQVAALDLQVQQAEAELKSVEEHVIKTLGSSGFCGFENETLGHAPSQPYGALGSATIVETAQSPFCNAFPIGTRGIAFPSNGENNAFGRTLITSHTPQATPVLYYNIDFRNRDIVENGDGAYRFYVGHGPGNSAAMELASSATAFVVKHGDQYERVCDLDMGTWYNIQVQLDLNSKTFAGTISTVNSVIRFENKAFTSGWDGIIDYTFVDRYGPGGGATPAHDIDNLVIATSPFLAANEAVENAAEQSAVIQSLAEHTVTLGALRQELAACTSQRDAFKSQGPFPISEMIYGARERDQVGDARVQLRGDHLRLGDVATRRNLEILGGEPLSGAGSGRRQLAEWLADEQNPLTARVMANRIWQHHFGRGLVPTENDFGMRGQRPSHPELLDWLASRFTESGWSMKAMHRLIMLSATYQQASQYDVHAAEIDPDARLLWRYNPRRLSAEEIRDAMLFVSGDLDPTVGGEHPFPAISTWSFTQHAPYYGVYESQQRSIYLMQQRIKRHPFMALFDGAEANVSTARRELTTVPTQALFLMNNPFVHERSESLARRWLSSAVNESRVSELFVLTLSRPGTKEELDEAVAFVAEYARALQNENPDVSNAEREVQAWSALVRSLLVRNEFLFVD